MPRGSGARCFGFISDDGDWAHCTREEYAGILEWHPNSDTYAHKLRGSCRCGERHDTLPATAANGRAKKKRIEATYDYLDASGELLYQVVRFAPKDFRQRRRDGNGRWTWGLSGIRRVLYRLPELLAADKRVTIYIAEGEEDVDQLRAMGLESTTNPEGAGKWQDEFSEYLRDRNVVVLPDNDEPGRRHAEQVARSLRGEAGSVKVLELPGLPDKGDVSDWLDAGGSAEELERTAHGAPEWRPAPEAEPAPDGAAEEDEPRRNQADRLIEYARADAMYFFVDQNGQPHTLVGREPMPLNSRCYSWLRRLMFDREGRSCTGEALKAAAGTLGAFAEFSHEVRELHTRSAWHDGAVYYELGPGRTVRIGPDGYGTVDDPPVLFRRFPNLMPLPDPERGGDLEDLCGYVNLKTARDRRLFVAYAVTVALPHVGRPVLNTTGPMGSGKTTLARLIKRLVDPTVPEFVRVGYRDFLQKAAHSYILALDNQSALPEEAVDTLCRLVTGEADSKRRLYTDDEDVIYQLRRAVILNAINPPSDRADLLDRSLMLELERIPDYERRSEEELWADFEDKHGRLLDAAFDILSKVLAKKPDLRLSRRPRLADWGEYAAAVYEVMGWKEGEKSGAELFLEDWDGIVKVQNQATLDGSPVALAIVAFMKDKEEHAATSSAFHKALENVAESLNIDTARDKAWPKSARWLWRRIKEVVPVLAAVGIEATHQHTDAGNKITLRKRRKK